MKEIKTTTVKYQAEDGKMFDDYMDCVRYEENAAINLKNFHIEIPFQDGTQSHKAYLVHSENEFNMLKAYILNNNGDEYKDNCVFDGCGWYVVLEEDGTGFVEMNKLSEIVKMFSDFLNYIVNKAMNE